MPTLLATSIPIQVGGQSSVIYNTDLKQTVFAHPTSFRTFPRTWWAKFCGLQYTFEPNCFCPPYKLQAATSC
ncbi:hypothetical protein BJP34_06485 [Moorena producens PAL-8-15-08-1]|uniref:Uncharacterized protein n=1 Tax=Moorena producens PAL-8-15-08-1 TaxID=1458985 RepID=A0A1D8TNG8_9CYAN|nr:hypothetical protein BJP34_06485 [Moorena producens PAL-8-15-08-1]